MSAAPTWVSPGHDPHSNLLSLLDGVQINLQYVVLQPTNQQSVVVCQQETVHILALIQPVQEEPTGQGLTSCQSYGLPVISPLPQLN